MSIFLLRFEKFSTKKPTRKHTLCASFTLSESRKHLSLLHHSAFCILHFAFCILHSAFCILHSAFCILHFAFCILHSAFCILHSALALRA